MGSISTMADLTASQTTDDSTDTETSDSDDGTSIPDVFDEIGAHMERVEAFFESYGEDSIEGLVELAELIRDEGEAVIEAAEDYRHSNGINRIRYNWGFDRGGDFLNEWFRTFYGDSDGTEEGTHNYIQAQAREAGVNLAWYKVLFPEPHSDYSEDSVQVTDYDELGLPSNDDLPDSNIFVPRWYAERFADSVNDEGVPLPPAEKSGEYGSASPEASDDVPDPSDYTVEEIKSLVSDIDDRETLVRMNEREREGDDRKTARKRIEQRINALGDEAESDSDDTNDVQEAVDTLAEAKGLDDEEREQILDLFA